jgi:hypothetical protein
MCDYLDFTGQVPLNVSGGPISAFTRCVLRVHETGIVIERVAGKLADGEWIRV